MIADMIFMKRNKSMVLIYMSEEEYVPGGSAGKESACNSGDPSSIPGLGRSPGATHSILAWRITWTV